MPKKEEPCSDPRFGLQSLKLVSPLGAAGIHVQGSDRYCQVNAAENRGSCGEVGEICVFQTVQPLSV